MPGPKGMMGGGGMGGGMGGGFRSVPATGLLAATLEPNQTRELPTQLVSLNGPSKDGRVAMPGKGEPLTIGSIRNLTADRWALAAVTRMAEDKAPSSVAQLVLWHIVDGFDWPTVEQYSRSWSNGYERTLASSFITGMRTADGAISPGDSGSIHWELTSRRPEGDALTGDLSRALEGKILLGLPLRRGIDETPGGPALAVRLRLDTKEIMVQVSASDERGETWVSVSKMRVELSDKEGHAYTMVELLDRVASGILGRVLGAQLIANPKAKGGKPTYTIRIDNASPLILNGLALSGPDGNTTSPSSSSCLAGLCLPPHRSLSLPISRDAVERLGLLKGVQLLAADLSAL